MYSNCLSPSRRLFNGQKLSLRAFFVMNLQPFVLWGAWQLLLPCWNLMNPNHLKLDIISYGVQLSRRRSTIKICDMASYSQLETWTYQKSSRKKREVEWSRWWSLMWGTMTTKRRKMRGGKELKRINFRIYHKNLNRGCSNKIPKLS